MTVRGRDEGATGGRGDWEKREFDAVFETLEQALGQFEFPASKSFIAEQAGSANVGVSGYLPLVRYLQALPDRQYATADEVKETLRASWHDSRDLRRAGYGASERGGAPPAEETGVANLPAGERSTGIAREERPSAAPRVTPAGSVVGKPNPPYEIIGVDALSPLLERVEFPATVMEIDEAIGSFRIPVSQNAVKPIHEILGVLAPQRFDSNVEFERAVKSAWEQIAGNEGRGGHEKQRDVTRDRPRRG